MMSLGPLMLLLGTGFVLLCCRISVALAKFPTPITLARFAHRFFSLFGVALVLQLIRIDFLLLFLLRTGNESS